MALGTDELAKMQNRIDARRVIFHSTYCSHCGFNLRHAALIGRCNECGNPYSARPNELEGIFDPTAARFPYWPTAVTPICGAVSVYVLRGAVNPINDWLILLGIVFAGLTLASAFIAFRDVRQLVRAWIIRGRIAREEAEDGL